MIAADTSTWIAFFEGAPGADVHLLDQALADRQVLMVPVVLTELLSDPDLPTAVARTLSEVPLIGIGLAIGKGPVHYGLRCCRKAGERDLVTRSLPKRV